MIVAADREIPADWLILHAGALGDLILTLQFALRLVHPGDGDRIHVIARANPGNLTGCRPSITWRSAETAGLHWLYVEGSAQPPEPLVTAIRDANVLSALGAPDSNVHRRIGLLGPRRLLGFDPRPRPGLRQHITAQWASDLTAQGLPNPKCAHRHPTEPGSPQPGRAEPGCPRRPGSTAVKTSRIGIAAPLRSRIRNAAPLRSPFGSYLAVPEVLRSRGDGILKAAGCDPPAVLIHPGSGGRRKCWPLACFQQVGRELAGAGRAVAVVIGPAEREWWGKSEVAFLGRDFPLIDSPDPDALAAILSAASAVVANDSGPAHLAALLGTRTIAIFGPTPPAVWRPLGQDVHVVDGDPGKAEHWGLRPREIALLAGG